MSSKQSYNIQRRTDRFKKPNTPIVWVEELKKELDNPYLRAFPINRGLEIMYKGRITSYEELLNLAARFHKETLDKLSAWLNKYRSI